MNTFNNIGYKSMTKSLSDAVIFEPDASSPIEIDNDALFTLVAWGDPQLFFASPNRSAKLAAACRDIANMRDSLDALVILGDIAESGSECEYMLAADIINTCSDNFKNFFCIPGNHDIRNRNYKKQLEIFRRFSSAVNNGRFFGKTRYFFSYDFEPCKFILMGSDMSTFEGAYYSPAQLRFLDEQLADAEKSGKPALVFNHQTLRQTNGLPKTWLGKGNWRGTVGWQSDKVREIFEKHKNTLYVTGHLHYGISRYNFEDCGCFKALSVPTVSVINHGDFSCDCQGYVISIYNDKIVIRARLFAEGHYVDDDMPGAKIVFPLN